LRDCFSTYDRIPEGEYGIRIANNAEINALGRGDVTLLVWDDGKQYKIELLLKDVLHVPACGENSLLSVSQLQCLGIFVEFPPSGEATMRYSNCSLVGVLAEVNGLYVLRPMRGEVLGHLGVNNALALDTGEGAAKEAVPWHFRQAHVGAEAVRRLSLEDNDIPSIWKVPRCVFTGCVNGKMARKPFPSVLPSSKGTQHLEIVHSYIAGLIDQKSPGGALYLLMFTDDFTRYKVGYLLKRKSEAFACFKEYKALVEKQQGKAIRKLRTDEGREYMSNELSHLLQQEGIEIQRTTPYTPQSNGVSERVNRKIIGTTRALLHAVSAPKQYWAEVAMTAIYVRNRHPTPPIQTGFTPYEPWHGRKPIYEHLQVWNCVAYAQVPKETRKKMDKAARKCIFIGYTDTTTQYRLYNPIGKHFVISNNVIFEESRSDYNTSDTVGQKLRCYYAPEIQQWEEQQAWGDEFDEEEAPGEKAPERRVREEEQEQVFDWGDAGEVLAPFHLHKPQVELSSAGQSSNGGDGDSDDDNDAGREEMPFVTTRKKRRKLDTPGMLRRLRADTNSSYWESQKGKLPTTEGMGSIHSKSGSGTLNTGSSGTMVSAVYMVEAGPNMYKAAMESDEACEWQEAINSEYVFLEKNKVLMFVHEIPETKKAITTKLILERKLNPVGQTVRYKAHFVAQGFRQVEGLDFTNTFALVASLSSVRVVLSIAAAKGFAVRQMDVVTALLGSELHEEV